MKITTKILLGLVLIVGGLLIFRVVLSSTFSVDGIALDRINNQLTQLQKEDMKLKEKIYTASSLTTIASDAAQLGFIEEKSRIALSGTSPLAINQ